MTYWLGILAAVASGVIYNAGILFQNEAVRKAPKTGSLMLSLVRSPVWLLGGGMQFVIGVPLNLLAVGTIGPAIPPAIMSLGLVVLALGGVILRKERPRWRDMAGIALIVAAVSGFALSHLSIDVSTYSAFDPVLLRRASLFCGVLAVLAAVCAVIPRAFRRGEGSAAAGGAGAGGQIGAFHAACAGLLYSVGSTGVGYVTFALKKIFAGSFAVAEATVFAVSLAIVIVGNVLAVIASQHALRHSRAVLAIALQNAISQIVPIGLFFLVYRPFRPGAGSIALVAAAAAALIAGIALLTGRISEGQGVE